MTAKTSVSASKYVFCDTSTVSIPRIAQLMEMSIAQKPFHNLSYQKMEIFDEVSILSSRVRAVSVTSYKTSVNRNSKYTLTYIDGQLVEVFDLIAERIIFRNLSNYAYMFCGRDYTHSPYWIDADEVIYQMEQRGEFLQFEPGISEHIHQHPEELVAYKLDDEGIIQIPEEYLELTSYSLEEYREIVAKSRKSAAPNIKW